MARFPSPLSKQIDGKRRVTGTWPHPRVAGIAGVGQSLARFPKDPEPAKGCR